MHVLFETHGDREGVLVSNGHLDGGTFPLEETEWADLFLRRDGGLTATPPAAGEGGDPYVCGSVRQAWSYQAGETTGAPLTTADGPDELVYRSGPLAAPLAIAGPLTATLFVQSTAPDTDLCVQVIDEAPTAAARTSSAGCEPATVRSTRAAATRSRAASTARGVRT